MKKQYLIGSTVLAALVAGGVMVTTQQTGEAAKQSKVLAVGSTALQPLAERAAQMYTEEHPKAVITVQGGGSGAGLSQVGKGGVTIGNSDIFAEQKDGVDAKKLKDHKVAVVGMTPVINDDVKVDNVTTAQLRDIFAGKITNWSEVGGQDEKIVLINRAQGSGTRATFEQAIMGDTPAATSQEQDDSGAVQKIVSQTPGAISYLAFSYTKGESAKDLKTLKIDGVKPSAKTVKNNKWKIWSYEHMYTKKKVDKATKKFVAYMTSKEVEKVAIKKLGYIPVSQMKVVKDADGDVTKK